MRLGIDFGTTRTVVAAAVDGRYPVAVFETARGYSDFVPSLAVRTPEGTTLGWDALAGLAPDSAAEAVVGSIKREVASRPPDDPLGELGMNGTALELAIEYLEHLRRSIVEHSNLDVDPNEPLEAMVAVPAHAATSQRYLTVEAFKRAGFTVLGLINEPTAAAIEYAHNNLAALGRRSPKRYVVVYDLGGGTFDTSAVSLVDRRFELLATEGIGRLGGDDFDAEILTLALAEAQISQESLSRVTRARLLAACREAKEGLSPSSRRLLVDLGTALPGADAVALDVERLNAACMPLVRRTLELLSTILDRVREHGIDPDNPRELGGVYLVGGATGFPLVSRTLRELYKRKVLLAPQAHAATAVGLAIAADPDAQVFVRESVTRHFGVWREGEGGRDKVFDPIIAKGQLPDDDTILVERRYHPVHAVGHLRFIECTGVGRDGRPEGDLTPWGELLFPYDANLREKRDLSDVPPDRKLSNGHAEIVERYSYGRDGTIAVSIENATHGYCRRYVLGQPGTVAAE